MENLTLPKPFKKNYRPRLPLQVSFHEGFAPLVLGCVQRPWPFTVLAGEEAVFLAFAL